MYLLCALTHSTHNKKARLRLSFSLGRLPVHQKGRENQERIMKEPILFFRVIQKHTDRKITSVHHQPTWRFSAASHHVRLSAYLAQVKNHLSNVFHLLFICLSLNLFLYPLELGPEKSWFVMVIILKEFSSNACHFMQNGVMRVSPSCLLSCAFIFIICSGVFAAHFLFQNKKMMIGNERKKVISSIQTAVAFLLLTAYFHVINVLKHELT